MKGSRAIADIDALVGILVDLLKVGTRIARPMRDGVADPEQLSTTELRIILALGGEGALAGHELADLMAMQPMNISRALASLLGMGLIEMAANEDNRRRKPYRLTRKGNDKNDSMLLRMKEVAQFLFSNLTESEKKTASGLLARLDARLIEWETPPELVHVTRA